MTINPSLRLAGLLALLVSTTACKHQSADTPTPTLIVTATTSTTLAPTIIPLTYAPAPPTRNQPEYVFDWENAQYVPNPATATPIPTPWSDQAKRAFSDDIRYDYRKADGWEMVYNASSTKYEVTTPILVLYNKYRGILRYYFYVSGGTQNIQGNNVMIQKLVAEGTSSPLLNFAEQTIVDIAKNTQYYSSLEPQSISDNTWYAMQSELAYDPNLATQSFATFDIQWLIDSDRISSLSINGGKPVSTLPTGIHIEGSNFYNTSQTTFTGTAQLLINGSQDITNLQTAGQSVSDILMSLQQTTTGNLLTTILTAQNTTTSQLLRIPVNIQLIKPVGHAAAVTSPRLALPGYDNSGPIGVTPQYNETPGVFYLDSKPVITTQTSTTAGTYIYNLDVASVHYLFNPAVTNSTDIKNIKQEIVATAVTTPDATPSANPTLYAGTSLMANQALNIVGVRVSFDVVPKTGSGPVHIIKTFKADIKPQ